MQTPTTTQPVLRILLSVLLADLLIFFVVGVVYYFSGWQTVQQYGNGLIWAGAAGVILLLASAGWRNGRREEQVALSKIMSDHEAFYLLNRDNSARARFLLVGLIAVAITFTIGLILTRVS